TKLAADGYHRRYPEIKLWHDVVWQTVLKKGQLKNPFGYRRVFLRACGHLALQGILDDHDWNDAVSSIPQSIPPFIINQAIVRCMQALPWVWFHHQGHDSFLASVPIGRVIEADTFMEQALRIEIPFDNGLKLVVPSEAQVGYTWGEMMPLVGVEPSEEQWKRWVMEESAVGRGRSSKSILMGINGIL
ncbi:MAG: hypothetical protein ACRD5H_07710, partial [Nitrososphaerales archaeon]